jgi:hypothetical protein
VSVLKWSSLETCHDLSLSHQLMHAEFFAGPKTAFRLTGVNRIVTAPAVHLS